ncbi:MAG TPA: hypothetical protein VEX40_12410, partial [Mycobacterium sp.]|nr:hypothetical protein [Mycobacterium sp.]
MTDGLWDNDAALRRPPGEPIYPVWTLPWRMRQSTAAQRHPDIGYEIADRLCEQDRLEQKDRARAVRYVKGSTHLHPDPAVNELVDAYSRSKSIRRQQQRADDADQQIRPERARHDSSTTCNR